MSIIDFFNSTCKTRYSYKNEQRNENIKARLNEGFTVDDFKTVIRKKYDEWHGTDMEKYLTPETLFRPTKFEKYLNQVLEPPKKEKPDWYDNTEQHLPSKELLTEALERQKKLRQ